VKLADTRRHNFYQSQTERKNKMATLDAKKIIGYSREATHSVTIWTDSPTGDSTDSLQFVMKLDTEAQCDAVTAVLRELWFADMKAIKEGQRV
jgi:hypothetical protein